MFKHASLAWRLRRNKHSERHRDHKAEHSRDIELQGASGLSPAPKVVQPPDSSSRGICRRLGHTGLGRRPPNQTQRGRLARLRLQRLQLGWCQLAKELELAGGSFVCVILAGEIDTQKNVFSHRLSKFFWSSKLWDKCFPTCFFFSQRHIQKT